MESNGVVSVKFPITNNQSKPIEIVDIESSCGCTSFLLGKDTIQPGETVQLTVEYNPKDRFGRFHKSVRVRYQYNWMPYEVLFTVRGNALKTKTENQSVKILDIKIEPFRIFPVSDYDTTFSFFPKMEGFINGITYEIDQHGFATLGVDHISYTVSNKGKMDELIGKIKKRIARGLEERGYKSYQVNYKQTEFDFNFIPDWAMSEIRIYSVLYSDEKVWDFQIKKEVPVDDGQRFKYIKEEISIDQLKKGEAEILDKFFDRTDLKLMINDSLNIDLEFRFPFKYDKKKGKKAIDKMKKKIDRFMSVRNNLRLRSMSSYYQTDTTFQLIAYQLFEEERKGNIKYIDAKSNIIPPLLPMAHYHYKFGENKVIDTSDVDMKRILANAVLHIQHGKKIVFNIESSMSHYPKKDKLGPDYHARRNLRETMKIIKGFMDGRNVDPSMYTFEQLPLVQGPKFSKKYSKSFYNRFEYMNVVPTFERNEEAEVDQIKYMVNYNSNSFTLDSNATMFKVFMKGIIDEINVFGYSKIILESSSSKAPTRTNMSSETISYKRAEETRDIMKNYLHRAGIDPNRLILVEETCLVQGPEYDLDYFENKQKYKQFQYIKIIPHRLLSE